MTTEIDRRSESSLHHQPAEVRRSSVADRSEAPDVLARPLTPVRVERDREQRIDVTAPDPRILLEEAAAALIRISVPPLAQGPAWRWESVTLRAVDLPSLAGVWLDRLIVLGESRLADGRREAVVIATVDQLTAPDDDQQPGRWQIRARVGLRPCPPSVATPHLGSPIDRPLTVESSGAGWTLHASLAD